MATLVLTAVGSALGGPIGGAIGAALGQQVDSAIFAPAAREGSRLKELAVQTSSYGTQIPGVFGAMRVAGTVIWSTDLIEQRVKSGGGKGRPATVNYSYRVSLAVAVSSRPVARLGRIWADGNLIRGASGDLKIDAQIRFHAGGANQAPDPLLASAEAPGQCPAHRGIAYVVFEDLQLAEFGNRIPSLTFEIFERDGPLLMSALLAEISGGDIRAESAIAIAGFAAAGSNVREAIMPILDVCPLELAVRDGQLVVRDAVSLHNAPHDVVIAADEDARLLERPKHIVPPAANIPSTISLRYYDPDRDYQAGVQHSADSLGGRREMRLELPAVMDATAAKRLVEAKANDVRYARDLWTASILSASAPYQPGDIIVAPDGRNWQITELEFGLGIATLTAKLAPKFRATGNVVGVPGRQVPSADQPIGETRIILVDLPLVTGGDPNKPVLAVLAAGTGPGWKRAGLSIKVEDQWVDIGGTAPSAIMGTTRNALAAHHAFLIDEASAIDTELLNSAMTLPLRNTSPLVRDAPIFWIGGEFVRVGCITAQSGTGYRLSRLLRGCHASSVKAPAHVAGTPIVLMDSSTALPIADEYSGVGQSLSLEAQGFGDHAPVTSSTIVEGLALEPLAPVHGHVYRNPDGGLVLEWKRRSRFDAGWVDNVDQVQVEDQERYRVTLSAHELVLREWEVGENKLRISLDELTTSGLPQEAAPIFTVRQIGRFVQSDPLSFAAR